MSEARGMGRDTLWYGVANLISGLLGFAALYLFSRLMAPAEFGVYTLLLTVASVINSLGFAWINQTLKRYYPALGGEQRAQFLGRVLAANLLTCGLVLALALPALLFLPGYGLSPGLAWACLALTAGTAAVTYVQWFYTIRRQAVDYTVNQLAYNVARLGLGWLLLRYAGATGEMLAWAVGLAGLLGALLGALRLREPLALSADSFDLVKLRAFAAYGAPLALVNGGGWLLNMAGRIVLGLLAGKAAVGVFGAAQQLAQQLVTLAVQPVITAADPLAVRLYERDGPQATARFLSLLFGIVVLLGSGVCLVQGLLAQPLADAVLDPEYRSGAALFALLAPAMLGWLLTPLLIKAQELGEQLGELPWLMLGAGALNVGLNFALIPRWGGWGAALAMLAANAALSLASYWRGRRCLPWPLPRRLLALCALGLLAIAAVHSLVPAPRGLLPVGLAFAGYMLGYLGLCGALVYGLPGIFRTEREFIRMVVQRRTTAAAAEPA